MSFADILSLFGWLGLIVGVTLVIYAINHAQPPRNFGKERDPGLNSFSRFERRK